MTSVLTIPMTKKVQSGDTSEGLERHAVSRGAERRHLTVQEQRLQSKAMREANGTKRKNECGTPQSCIYFLSITHRKHSRRFSVKVLEAVVEPRYTTEI